MYFCIGAEDNLDANCLVSDTAEEGCVLQLLVLFNGSVR